MRSRWIVGVVMLACSGPPQPQPSPQPPPSPSRSSPPSPSPSPPPAPSASPSPEFSTDLVDVAAVIPDALLDIRYAPPDNFTPAPLYAAARCLLRRDVAARLARAADALRAEQRRLLLWDCYRPASVQRELWGRVPVTRYVAEPTFAAD